MYGKSENDVNSSVFGNMRKCLSKINTRLLMKSIDNKTDFVARDRAIRVMFDFKNLFTSNDCTVGWWWSECPSTMILERITL